jgi:hypothetical protein
MSEQMSLVFQECESDQEIKDIYNFNVHAFADTQDFEWSEENIKKEIGHGWKVLSVTYEKDILAAVLLKIESKTLFTKNTPIKIDYQGNGFSHLIKDFFEQFAEGKNIETIINYCPDDNFRMISLNEGHKYTKTGKVLGEHSNIIEWQKSLI